MRDSWRHHYIPQFQLRGFTDASNSFYVYDKVLNKIKRRGYSPKSHFFEPFRNTVIVPGVDPNLIEKYYAEYDQTVSCLFERLRGSPRPDVDLRMIADLKVFVSMLFWRIPSSDRFLEAVVKKLGFKGLGFRMLTKDTNEVVQWPAFEDLILNDFEFRKAIRFLVLPAATFNMLIEMSDQSNWAIYRTATDNTNLHICSDNPLVFEKLADGFKFSSNLAFPVSSNCFVFYTPSSRRPGAVDPETRIELDTIVFRQAERLVSGPNKDYLASIVQLADIHTKNWEIETHRMDFFSRMNSLYDKYPPPVLKTGTG